MSYTILYAKQFIKVDDENVIPFMLMGDNNVYEGTKRARDWQRTHFFGKKLVVSKKTIEDTIDNLRTESIERCNEYVEEYDDTWAYDDSRFGYHVGIAISGKHTSKTTFKMFKNFYMNGVKNAKTIEELAKLGCSIAIRVSHWDAEKIKKEGLEIKPTVAFTSTQHMIDTIREYEEYYKEINVNLYLDQYGISRIVKTK